MKTAKNIAFFGLVVFLFVISFIAFIEDHRPQYPIHIHDTETVTVSERQPIQP